MGNLHLHFIIKMKHATKLFYEEGWSICLFIFGFGYLQNGDDNDYG